MKVFHFIGRLNSFLIQIIWVVSIPIFWKTFAKSIPLFCRRYDLLLSLVHFLPQRLNFGVFKVFIVRHAFVDGTVGGKLHNSISRRRNECMVIGGEQYCSVKIYNGIIESMYRFQIQMVGWLIEYQ